LEYNTIKAILCSANRCDQEKFIFHKTTLRPWDKIFNEVKEKGFDEVIFINERNEVLEGAISNIIIKQNGKYYTPPIKLKILNGCYRQNLIDSGKCEEKIIKVDELKSAEKVILCNSVKKELEVKHIFDENNNLIFCCN
jgi:para-aminobenzoate synthetase/4-amino-4-deoxychorismate lyase